MCRRFVLVTLALVLVLATLGAAPIGAAGPGEDGGKNDDPAAPGGGSQEPGDAAADLLGQVVLNSFTASARTVPAGDPVALSLEHRRAERRAGQARRHERGPHRQPSRHAGRARRGAHAHRAHVRRAVDDRIDHRRRRSLRVRGVGRKERSDARPVLTGGPGRLRLRDARALLPHAARAVVGGAARPRARDPGSHGRFERYSWTLTPVNGSGAPIERQTDKCEIDQGVPELGETARVSLLDTPAGDSLTAESIIDVHDVLVVSLGDSMASGEGNPDDPGDYVPLPPPVSDHGVVESRRLPPIGAQRAFRGRPAPRRRGSEDDRELRVVRVQRLVGAASHRARVQGSLGQHPADAARGRSRLSCAGTTATGRSRPAHARRFGSSTTSGSPESSSVRVGTASADVPVSRSTT